MVKQIKHRHMLTIFSYGVCLLFTPISLAADEPAKKPVIKAIYKAEIPSIADDKPQLSLFPDLNQLAVTPTSHATAALKSAVILDNGYPLPKPEPNKAAKKRVKASYSEHGILSDLGVEKRKVYQYEKNGITVFSDNQPAQGDFRIHLYECFACRPDSTIDWYHIPLFTKEYAAVISNAAKRYQLEPALIRAVIHAESAFRTNVVSNAGAMGLMQLMPGTAKDMQVSNAFHAEQNINGGSRYLAKLLGQFNGDIDLACAAYNAGPTNVEHYQGIPPFPETQAYVQRVKILYSRYRKAS